MLTNSTHLPVCHDVHYNFFCFRSGQISGTILIQAKHVYNIEEIIVFVIALFSLSNLIGRFRLFITFLKHTMAKTYNQRENKQCDMPGIRHGQLDRITSKPTQENMIG